MTARRQILHISGDFPDSVRPAKTPVIRSLLAMTAGAFDHRVISINRASPGWRFAAAAARAPLAPALRTDFAAPDGTVTPLTYFAPSKGLYHRTMLDRLADPILGRIARDGLSPALIVGHKLTIEGFVAARVAAALGVPYALTIQGGTDVRITAMRPDLGPALRRILAGAATIFCMTPWAKAGLEHRLGPMGDRAILLPAPTEMDAIRAPRINGPHIATLFHLDHWRLKNVGTLIDAVARLQPRHPDLTLAIHGGGGPDAVRNVERRIARSGARNVTLAGAAAHAAVPDILNQAGGFALPTLRESFGLVFVEALLAGCPIVYPRGRAVDGYFDGLSFAIAIDPADVRSVAEGVERLIAEEAALKSALAEWQQTPAAARFQRDSIAAAFAAGLDTAMAAPNHQETSR